MQPIGVRPNEIDPRGDEQSARIRPWVSLPWPARVFTAAVIAAGVAVLCLTLQPSVDFTPMVLAIAATAALTASLRLPLPTMRAGATLSASFIVNFASLLTLGANATTLVAIAGAISQSGHNLKGGRQLYRTLFNVACIVITVQAAAMTSSALGGVAGALTWPQALPPLVGSVITYFVVNTGVSATVIALSTSRPVGRVWHERFLGSGPSYFIGAAFATAVAETIVIGHWEILLAVAAPAGLSLWAYKVHAESSLALQESLRRAAQHDTLTGLPNRALFVELLQHALNHGRRNAGVRSAMLFLDLDRFKIVNDTLGHVIGDELLVVTSKRLRSCLRDSDTLARLGGDEFVILLQDPRSVNEATLVADRIQRAVQAPLSLGGRDIFVSASIGIAMSRDSYADPIVIMRDADAAMYRAKAAGKARYVVFNDGMHQQILDRLALETQLREAVEQDGLSVCYQPIMNLTTRQPVGLEALARWTRAGQEVPPSVFIPVAEEIGLMDQLGAWILRTACREFADLRDRFPAARLSGVTVNVSSSQLTRPVFVSVVLGALREAGLSPGALQIEITETAFVRNPDAVASVLLELRSAGIKISVGDFGTGLSSLSHLLRVPIDVLKIDRPLVETVTTAGRPMTVESILAVAMAIGSNVTAEGVETDAQLLELKRLGCDHAQGFLFARPMSARAVEAFLASFLTPEAATASQELSAEPAPTGGTTGPTVGVTLH